MKNRFELFRAAKVSSCQGVRKSFWFGVAAGLFLLVGQCAHGAPFRNLVVPFTQPDGTRIEVIGSGDEFYAKFETKDGYTVVFDHTLKAYCYAKQAANGQLESTGVQVQKSTGEALGVQKHIRMSNDARKTQFVERYQKWQMGTKQAERWQALKATMRARESGAELSPPSTTTVGTKVALCLLIDFDDDEGTVPQADIIDFCNGDNYTGYGNNGSIKQYYKDVSNGKLIYTNVVTAYIRIPDSLHAKSYYNDTSVDSGVNANNLISDALTILKAESDYTTDILPTFDPLTVDSDNQVVAMNVFYAGDNGGVWAYGLWPHSWSLYYTGPIELSSGGKKVYKYQITNIGDSLTIGTFCHENGHMLCGYPDLYDYDYDSIGGAGYFCLMSAGAFDNNPVQICAYLKRASGWATVTELDSSSGVLATLGTTGTNFNRFYRYQKPNVSTEYFLLENRFASGRDSLLPASGIAVWHVDELGDRDNQSLVPNSSHANYELTLDQADNKWDFENNVNEGDANDLYYSSNSADDYSNAFNDETGPSANWWDGTDSGFNAYDFSDKSQKMSFVIGYPSYVSIGYVTNTISGGNLNGMIDYNECNNLTVTITNKGTIAVTDIKGVLSTTNENVFLAQSTADFSVLTVGGISQNLTSFEISTSPEFVCGTPIRFMLVLKTDAGNVTNTFVVKTGTTGKAYSFDSATVVKIPDNYSAGVYSPITVSGMNGLLTKVTCSMYIEHTADSDLTFDLIAPDGTTIRLASQVGGSGNNFGDSCDGTRTTFDDSAATLISDGYAPFTGSYKPEQLLSTFDNRSGTNVNGVWKLHVIDSAALDTGTIECWSLSLTTSHCIDGGGECSGVDLSVTLDQSPVPGSVGSPLTYTMVVSNTGPSTAKGVMVSQTLPLTEDNGVAYSYAILSQGSATPSGDIVNCNLGNLLPAHSATVAITVIPKAGTNFTTTATVGATSSDYNSVNNYATLETSIFGGRADLGVSTSAAPNPVLAGSDLIYTVNVLNYGPSTATNVIVTNYLPLSVTNVVVTTSQGTGHVLGTNVWTELGNIETNTTATYTIKVTPKEVGQITATTFVSSDMLDPITSNNRTTVTSVVGPSADLGVTIKGDANPVLVNGNVTYTITVVNNGPSKATDVSMTYIYPTAANFVSSSASQGTLDGSSSGLVVGNLGSLDSGASATVTIVMQYSAEGSLTSSVSVSAGQSDAVSANNTASIKTSFMPPVVILSEGSKLLLNESIVPANGVVEAGETVTVSFGITNQGTLAATNVVAQLQLGGGVLMPQINYSNGVAPLVLQSFGTILPGTVSSNAFNFTAVSTNIGTIQASMLVQYTQFGSNVVVTVPFTFQMPQTTSFANQTSISIPDQGDADPYPSKIEVSGVSGTVKKVTATLVNFGHTSPHDVSVLLVSPNGRSSVLMAHPSKNNGLSSGQTVTLTFDDEASSVIPPTESLITGSFRPAKYMPNVEFSEDAPEGPYVASLSEFGGFDPNGTWKLYVTDDTPGDLGSIAGGWILSVTTVDPVNPMADLEISAVASTNSVLMGTNVKLTLTVTNAGPSIASDVLLTNVMPAGLSFVSSSVAGQVNGNTFTTSLGSLAPSNGMVVVITALVNLNGSFTNVASVGSPEIDFCTVNDSAEVSVTGMKPTADLEVSILDYAEKITTDSTLNYSVQVANAGPNDAVNVILTNILPSGFKFVSANPSQGTSSYNDTTKCMVTSFGTISSGSVGIVTVNLMPGSVGLATNMFVAVTDSTDTNLGNNVAGFVTTVKEAGPIIITDGAKLVSENLDVNGAIDSGETVTLEFRLANTGSRATTNLVAVLQSGDGVANSVTQNYGAIGVGTSVSRPFTFTAQGTTNGILTAKLTLTDGSLVLDPVSYTFQFPTENSYANTNNIVIPESGSAYPCPSTITVSGLTGYVSKVTVTLKDVSHAFPRDINATLVSPDGTCSIVMSHAGGAYAITNQTFVFSGSSSNVLSATNRLVSGSYLPTKYGAAVAYPSLGNVGICSFDVFEGVEPNGTWSLYVVDDSVGDGGAIAGGWSLDVEVVKTVNDVADLAVSMDVSAYANTLSLVTNTITVVNNGPSDVANVVVTNLIPENISVVSAVSLQGLCNTNVSGIVTCDFGTVKSGEGESFTVVMLTGAKATTTSLKASVTGDAYDTSESNNSVTQNLIITLPQDSKLTAIYLKESNSVQLTLVGQASHGYVIESSTNLTSWTVLSTNTLSSGGSAVVVDKVGASCKFYRAVRQ